MKRSEVTQEYNLVLSACSGPDPNLRDVRAAMRLLARSQSIPGVFSSLARGIVADDNKAIEMAIHRLRTGARELFTEIEYEKSLAWRKQYDPSLRNSASGA